MNTQTSLCLLLLVISQWCFAQGLRGVVINRSEGSRPEVGVRITPLTGGANPQTTNSVGQFDFQLPQLEPGAPVELIVQKDGYVILGSDETIYRLNLPATGTTIKIALVRREDLRNLERDYVRAIERQLRRAESERNQLIGQLSTDTLQVDERAALTRTISRQSQEMEELRRNKEELAQRLAKIDLEEASEFAKQALKAFQEEGDLEAALQLMTEKEVTTFWENVINQEEKVERARAQAIENFMIRGRLLQANLQFTEALEAFEAALEKDSTNVQYLVETAFLLNIQRQDQQSVELYEAALQATPPLFLQTDIYNNLGTLYAVQNRPQEAEEALLKSLSISRQLALSTPEQYSDNIASVLGNLGLLYARQEQWQLAEQHLTEARDLYGTLVEKYPGQYELQLANTYSRLGEYFNQRGQFGSAQEAMERSLHQLQQLAQQYPDVYRADLAFVQNNLGAFYMERDQYEHAQRLLDSSLLLRQTLMAANPAAHRPDLAATLNNLGNLARLQGQLKPALDHFNQSIQIRKQLTAEQPQIFTIDLARSLNNLGVLYEQNGQFTEATNRYVQGLEYLTPLVTQKSGPLLSQFVNLQYNLLDTRDSLIEHQRYEDALATTQRVAGFWEQLLPMESEPKEFPPFVAEIYKQISWLALVTTRFSLAQTTAERGLELVENHPFLHSHLAMALLLQGKRQAAKTIYQTHQNRLHPDVSDTTWRDAFLADLELLQLESDGIEIPKEVYGWLEK